MKNIFFSVAIAFGILILASSCLKSGDTSNPMQGALLISNLSPDAPAVNISLNSKPYIGNLNYPYGTYTFGPPYSLLTAGSYSVDVTDASNANIFSHTITIDPNKYYSYFVIDSFAKVKYAFMEDKLITPGADSAYIRFLHFSPDAGTISLRDSATKKYFYISRNFNDQNSSPANAAFNEIKQDTLTLQLVHIVSVGDTAVIASKKDTLSAGHVYTILAEGFLNGTDDDTLVIKKIQNF